MHANASNTRTTPALCGPTPRKLRFILTKKTSAKDVKAVNQDEKTQKTNPIPHLVGNDKEMIIHSNAKRTLAVSNLNFGVRIFVAGRHISNAQPNF